MAAEIITRVRFKVVLVGDRAVGKTSLLNRFAFNYFSPEYKGTLGSTLHILKFQETVGSSHLVEAETAFFDLMGEKGVRDNFREVLFWGTQGFLAVADITRRETIQSLSGWIRIVQSIAGDIPFRILMNKADLAENGSISPEDTALLLNEFPGVPYHLTSAKTGLGVERAFESLLDTMIGVAHAKSNIRRRSRIVGNKILAFAKRRGLIGISKQDIMSVFKEVDINALMREIEDLQALGLVTLDLSSPSSFRLKITEKGERELERLGAHDGAIEDLT